MPRKSRRTQGTRTAAGLDAPTLALVDRIVSAGTSAVTSLLAWLWAAHPTTSPRHMQRFCALTPTAALSSNVAAYLASCGLLVETIPMAWLDQHSLLRWRLSDELQDVEAAQGAALQALAHLQSRPSFAEEVCTLWRALAVAEVLGFMSAELVDHQFDDRWVRVLEPQVIDAVTRLSVSHSFYFCWLTVRDLASAYLRFPAARDRLPDTLRRSFESKLAKSQAEAWITRALPRHARCPESAIAAVSSSVVTSLGDRYLQRPASLNSF